MQEGQARTRAVAQRLAGGAMGAESRGWTLARRGRRGLDAGGAWPGGAHWLISGALCAAGAGRRRVAILGRGRVRARA